MFRDFPIWFWILAAFGLGLGLASMSYVVSECGWGGLLLGNSGVGAALLGFCD